MNYYRNHQRKRSEAASKRAKSGWVKRHAEMALREPTADDLHHRAIQDRRGEAFVTLQTVNHDTGRVTRITLHHSTKGRSDQFQVTINNRKLSRPMGLTEVFNKWKTSVMQGAKTPEIQAQES